MQQAQLARQQMQRLHMSMRVRSNGCTLALHLLRQKC